MRAALYRLARLLGDMQAVRRDCIARRVANKTIGRKTDLEVLAMITLCPHCKDGLIERYSPGVGDPPGSGVETVVTRIERCTNCNGKGVVGTEPTEEDAHDCT